MKKFIAILMTLMMVTLMLTACNSPSTTEPATSDEGSSAVAPVPEGEVKTYGEDETLNIAYIGWGFVDETSLFYERNFEMLASTFNINYTYSDAWANSASAEDIVEVLPSLIEAGTQGVILHSMSARIVEMCNEAGVYFTLSGETIIDEELQALCDASPYWVGSIALGDYDAGYAAVEYLVNEEGATNIGYVRASTRTLEENRYQGAMQAIKDLGVTLVGEYCGQEQGQAIQDLAANFPQMDGLVMANGAGGSLSQGITALESTGRQEEIAFVTIGPPSGYEAEVESGVVDMIIAGEGIEPTLCTMLLVNAMRGNRVEDTAIKAYVPLFPVTTGKEVEDYSVYFASDATEFPLTAEMLESEYLKKNNSELDNAYFEAFLEENYNINSFNESHGR